MNPVLRLLRTVAALAVVVPILATTAPVRGDDVPGARDAIEAAIEAAATEAVEQALASVPADIDAIGIGPLFTDEAKSAAGAVEHALVQAAQRRGLKILTRQDADWNRLTAEWVFTEDNFDVMPAAPLPDFRKVLPAGAAMWGQLEYARLDDSGYKAQVSIRLWLGVVATGQVAGSGHGKTVVPIDAETFLLAMTHEPWFVPAVVAVVVVAIVLVAVAIPLRRRMALASKPREVSR